MSKDKVARTGGKKRTRPLWQRVLLIAGITALCTAAAWVICEKVLTPVYVDTAEVSLTIDQEAMERLVAENPDDVELVLDLLNTGLKSEFTGPGSSRKSDLRNGQVKALFYYLISDDLAASYGYDPKEMESVRPSYLEKTLITKKALGDDRQTLLITVSTDNPAEAELAEQVARSAAGQLGVLIFGAEAAPEQADITVEAVEGNRAVNWQVSFRLSDEAVASLPQAKFFARELDLSGTVSAFRTDDALLRDVLSRAGSDALPSDLRGRLAVKSGIGTMNFTVTWPADRDPGAAELASAAAETAAAHIFGRTPEVFEVSFGEPAYQRNHVKESPNTPVIVGLTALAALALSFFLFSGLGLIDCLIVIFFTLFTFICVFPFYYLFINTISDNNLVAGGQINFLPRGLHLNNYTRILGQKELYDALIVTVGRTVLGTVLMVLTSAWAGYLVTKQKMWHRSFWYRALVITMYFNAGLIPWYTNMLMLGLTGNFLAYIIPGMVAPYNIILVKTYIESIPGSLEESAIIDGASTFKVFLRIILPLSIPILATIAIFGAVGNWNSFQDSLLLMSSTPNLYTLQHRLYIYLNQTTSINTEQISEQMAQNLMNNGVTTKYTIAMVTIIPILLVYPFMQRYFVKGIMLGAVKG